MPKITRVEEPIVLVFTTIDRLYETKKFKSVEGAVKYVRKRLGRLCDMVDRNFAVTAYGDGTLSCRGGQYSLEDLWKMSLQ